MNILGVSTASGVSRLGILLIVVVAVGGAVAGPSGTLAQGPVDAADPEPAQADRETRARTTFELGVAAYRGGRLDDAVEALRESLALSPRVTTAFNLALALAQMGRDAAAATIAADLLRGEYGSPDDEQRERVGALLATAEAKAVRLTVVVTGAGDSAWVRVDGGPREALRDERTLWLAQGAHAIEVGASGVASQRSTLALVNGERRRLAFDLRQAPGLLVVTGPAERPIEIVDVLRGRGRIEATLAPGTYQVGLVEGPHRSVVIEPGDSKHISLLDASSPAAVPDRRRRRRWGIALGVVVVAAAALGLGFGLARRQPEVEGDPHLGVFEALTHW
ncbi:MAG: hypothetical protein CMN30_02330 [Sandaracinus sp.]|nr:hypothetical protein [Sandaracinus sp.]|tara:strand:+ start:5764 stop:6768 length:1005 start_codon:yes stop_codon:yes gene_type:complete